MNKLLIRPYIKKNRKNKKKQLSNIKIQLPTISIKSPLEEGLKPSKSGKASWKIRPMKNPAGDNREQRY